MNYIFCTKKINRIKLLKVNNDILLKEDYIKYPYDNAIIKLDLDDIKFDSSGNIIENKNRKFANKLIRTSSKEFVKLSKFKKEISIKKTDYDTENNNNKSEIKNLILEGNLMQINILNELHIQDKMRIMNKYEIDNSLIPKYQTFRDKKNSNHLKDIITSHQK